MADIRIRVEHGTSKDRAREVTAGVLQKMADKMGVTAAWSGDTATLSGMGVKAGAVTVDDHHIGVEISLSLVAKPMKGFLEEKVGGALQRALQALGGAKPPA